MVNKNLTGVTLSHKIQVLFVVLVGGSGVWLLGRILATGEISGIATIVLVLGIGFSALILVVNWQLGLFFLLGWIVFEDLVRKYTGNNLLILLVKDVLVLVIYSVVFLQWWQGRLTLFRPPFLFSLLLMIWIGTIQVFNPASPSIFYGLVGWKLYFFYIPLLFVGYALIDTERTLHIFLIFSLIIACVVAIIGIIQSIVGAEFLNPDTLAPELEALNRLFRKAPEEGVLFYRTPGVFVSDGRFGQYMQLMFVVSLGTLIYFSFANKNWIFLSIPMVAFGLCATALIMSGLRGASMRTLISFVALVSLMVWNIRQTRNLRSRFLLYVGLVCSITLVGIVAVAQLYPEEFDARWQFYTQTLVPGTEHSEIEYRVLEFPVSQFSIITSAPLSAVGYGIGTASQATLYVPDFFGVPRPSTPGARESGFGVIAVELGYLGLLCWLIWSTVVIYSCWKIMRQLRQTRFLPLGVVVFWVTVMILLIMTINNLTAYQNFVNNIYLWLLIGVLFKLPTLLPGNDPAQLEKQRRANL
jgi:hypothetical protein